MIYLPIDDVFDLLKYANDLQQLQINPCAVKNIYLFEFKAKATQVILNDFSLNVDLEVTF